MSEESPEIVPVSEKPVIALFRYSQFVHVGNGAGECEHAEDGTCADRAHFHAWITMPNQFQQESLQQKARAARARIQRALRDPQTDAFMVLQTDLEELRESATEEQLIDFLVSVNDMPDRLDAMRELESTEEWEHRTEDVLRRRELEVKTERTAEENDELAQLVREAERFSEMVTAKMKEAQAPKRSSLQSLSKDQLLEQWRDQRVQSEGASAFTNAYVRQQWFTCTLRSDADRARTFGSADEMEQAAPEVIEALDVAFRDLDSNMQREVSGNW